jgi:GT2 family glycosyltransferase
MSRKVAVVILNWNGKKLMEQFLQQVIDYSPQAEIIVADNASTDDSVDFLKTNFPDVRIIQLPVNYGFAGGYNKALEQVNADYYMLLNSDVQVTEGWLVPLTEFLDRHPETAACQPKIKSYSDKHLFEHAGAAGGFIDFLGYPFCRGRIFNQLEEDRHQYDSVTEVFWATGACMLIRSEVFRKLHGFDERFFAHMEEIDLCWRIQRAGYKIHCIPSSVVFHVGGGTLPKKNPRKTYYNFRNNLMMLHNNLPSSTVFPVIFFRLFLDGIAALKFLFEGDVMDCISVLKSHYYFHTRVLLTGGKRRELKRELPFRKINVIYRKSLVWNYFIRKKKFFSLLNFKPE